MRMRALLVIGLALVCSVAVVLVVTRLRDDTRRASDLESRTDQASGGSFVYCLDNYLWVVGEGGGQPQRLAGGPSFNSDTVSLWPSRDGRKVLAVEADATSWLIEGGGLIRPLPILGSGESPPREGIWPVKWSADGVWVAFTDGGEVWAVNTQDGRRYCPCPYVYPEKGEDKVREHLLGWALGRQLAVVRITVPFGNDTVARNLLYLRPVPDTPASASGDRRLVELPPGPCHASVLSPDEGSAALWIGAQIVLINLSNGEHQTLASDLAEDAESGWQPRKMLWPPDGDALLALCPLDDANTVNPSDEPGAVPVSQGVLGWRIALDGSGASPMDAASAESALFPARPTLPAELEREIGENVWAWELARLLGRIAYTVMPQEYWLAPPAPADAVTKLEVSSEPPGAEVYVNVAIGDRGILPYHYKGSTPCVVTITSAESWAQRYRVALMKDDLDIECRDIMLRQGEHEKVLAALDTPLTDPELPTELAVVRNAVRKAIVHDDVEGFLRHVPPEGIVDYYGEDQRKTRHFSREEIRRELCDPEAGLSDGEYAYAFCAWRRLFLTGEYSGWTGDDPLWGGWADLDSYDPQIGIQRVGGQWYVTTLGLGPPH